MVILFVCYANLNRSPRAEMVCRRLLEQRGASHLFDVWSAGTHTDQAVPQYMRIKDFERIFKVPMPKHLVQEMVDAADIIVGMDLSDGVYILSTFPEIPIERIECLNIPDEYSLAKGNTEELFWLLETKLPPMVDRWIAQASTEP